MRYDSATMAFFYVSAAVRFGLDRPVNVVLCEKKRCGPRSRDMESHVYEAQEDLKCSRRRFYYIISSVFIAH